MMQSYKSKHFFKVTFILMQLFLGLSMGYGVNPPQEVIDMGLLESVYEQDRQSVQSFLSMGADVNARDFMGTTALMYALMGDDIVIADMLLAEGADLNLVDDNGLNVLMYGIIGEKYDFVLQYISLFTQINHQDNSGYTPLIYAAQTENLAVVEELLNLGANIDIETQSGSTALMHAAAFGNFYIVDFLAFHGADVDHQAEDGSAALHLAAWYGNNEIIGLLIDWGADVEIKDHEGNTALMVAVLAAQLETTWYLIEAGANFQLVNNNGMTLLSAAISLQDTQMVELLLDYGLEDTKTDKYNSAVAYSFFFRNASLRRQLVHQAKASPRGLYFSEIWIGQGLDFNRNDNFYHASAGIFESRYRVHLSASFFVRTGHRQLNIPQTTTLTYRMHEKRYMWSLAASYEWILLHTNNNHKAGFMPGVEVAYTYGNYRGTSLTPPEGLKVIPSFKAFWHFSNKFSFWGGYSFFDTHQNDIPVHRFRIGLAYRFSLFSLPAMDYRPVLH